ncbi:MAG: hypothetical protein OXG44_06235 [Gammaproteobacteria bacterium]|nr:hypothetical protein [Gammaproteobacteria bacterium]
MPAPDGGRDLIPHIDGVAGGRGVNYQRRTLPVEPGTFTEADLARIRADLATAAVERRQLERELGLV